jgi:hypothetical protein
MGLIQPNHPIPLPFWFFLLIPVLSSPILFTLLRNNKPGAEKIQLIQEENNK